MKTVIGAALGECVHVAGVLNFLRLAEEAGWRTVFLGPAVPVEAVLEAARREQAELVGVSYRLTPETGERLLGSFAEAADELRGQGVRFAFGGTPPLAERARAMGFFERVFEGGEPAEMVLAYLKGQTAESQGEPDYPQTTVERIRWKAPYPLLRHHFGLPTVEETAQGIEKIAAARALDVISLGIDQDAQENFFHPERQDPRRRGAGGVPVRSAEDYRALYAASRQGNYPLMRTYSGTDDFIRLAEMYTETIHNAWAAVPLFWFNQMDGRGPWDLEGSIREHQQVMAWYGERSSASGTSAPAERERSSASGTSAPAERERSSASGTSAPAERERSSASGTSVPVELNEPHHWGMRDAPDVVFVVSAYLSAYNARACGVKDYIAQLMFNSPPGHSDAMDLAKMLAALEIIDPLAGPDFRIWRQTRTGLLSYPLDPVAARAHLCASIYLQMALKPHIIHVVGHTEAHHAATAEDVIEACGLARRVIENALKGAVTASGALGAAVRGAPDMTEDPHVQRRKDYLIGEALLTIRAIRRLGHVNDEDADASASEEAGSEFQAAEGDEGGGRESRRARRRKAKERKAEKVDPLTDPAVLAKAVGVGLLDAPHLRGSKFARGTIKTRMIKGCCEAVDEEGKPIAEVERVARIVEEE